MGIIENEKERRDALLAMELEGISSLHNGIYDDGTMVLCSTLSAGRFMLGRAKERPIGMEREVQLSDADILFTMLANYMVLDNATPAQRRYFELARK